MNNKILLLLLVIFFVVSCKGSGSGSGNGNENPSSPSGPITLGGTVSFIRNSLISSAYADETKCNSSCNRQAQNCAVLYRLAKNNIDKDEKLCETPVGDDGKYEFNILDKSKIKDQPLQITIENFKGSKREKVFLPDVDSGKIEKDIDPLTTASSQSLKDEIKQGGDVRSDSDEDHKTLLENELMLMCPSVINSSNVQFVIKNTINLLARDRGTPLFITYRNLVNNNLSLISIQSELNAYCSLVSSILSNQNSSNLKIRLVDKQGNPYANMQMYIGENNLKGSIYTTSGNGVFKTTDANGYFDISGLSYGGHSLIIGDYSWYTTNFLWTADEKYIGYFYYDQNLKYQEIVFPKVLKSQSANLSSAPDFRPSNGEKYFAQSFSLTASLQFCGVGLGLGIGNRGRPQLFQIRSDDNGTPSNNVLYENKVYGFTGALSKGGEDVFSNFCNKYTNVVLGAGTYWVVGVYDSSPAVIAAFGSESQTANGLPIKSSIDGITWSNANLSVWYNGTKAWNMLDFFITE